MKYWGSYLVIGFNFVPIDIIVKLYGGGGGGGDMLQTGAWKGGQIYLHYYWHEICGTGTHDPTILT